MARIAVGLFIICNVLAATAFTAQSRFSSLCTDVGEHAQQLPQDATLGGVLHSNYCA